jgi:hypothetical protein
MIKEEAITAQQLRENLNLDVLWQGNPLSCVKMFKTYIPVFSA